MIHFPPLRTQRLTIQLKELSIGAACQIAAMPIHAEQAACTAFLRRVVDAVTSGPSDPAQWTVQERTMVVCHYMASTLEDGPNFSVGTGNYSDYLDGANNEGAALDFVEAGELGGDLWHVRHLTGAMAESIERMEGEVGGMSGYLHWVLATMALQMVRDSEETPPEEGTALDNYLAEKMQVLAAYPESDFIALRAMYEAGRDKLHHLFRVVFSRDNSSTGIIVLPQGGVALPPARFPAYSCVSGMAREMVGSAG